MSNRKFGVALLRREFIEIIINTIIMASGINVFTSSITGDNNIIILIAGLSIISFGLMLILRSIRNRLLLEYNLEGVYSIQKSDRAIVKIDGYKFSERLHDDVNAIFIENKTFKARWMAQPPKFDTLGRENFSLALISEAIEYFAVSRLSTHLTDYFNSSDIDERHIVKIDRKAVASIVYSNRFLDLLSREMEDRESFRDFRSNTIADESQVPQNAIIVSAYGPGGIRFHRFELILPTGTMLSRDVQGNLLISNDKFSMKISSKATAFHAGTLSEFDEIYLGTSFGEIDHLKADLCISVKFPLTVLLRKNGWKYIGWVDSYINVMIEEFDFKLFLQSLSWPSVVALNKVLNRHR